MQTKTRMAGLALVEVMVVLVISAVVVSNMIPAFTDLIERHRLKAATENLYSDLQLARVEAIKRNKQMRVNFLTSDGGATWCYGVREQSACDCNADSGSSLCHIDNVKKVVRSTDFPNVRLKTSISSPGDRFAFESVRGITSSTFGKVILTTGGLETRVIVSRLARVRYCSPAGGTNVPGYNISC